MAGQLSDSEARQVLKYWLGAIRFEESLASRPRAHPPGQDDAASTQPYFRLGGEHAAFWTSARGATIAAIDPAVQRFHRHWQRWRAAARRRGEAGDGAWIAGWPAVFFERRDEIATLFRFPVTLEWAADGVTVRAADTGDDEPALSLDRQLLHDTLGLLDEEIDEVEAVLGDDSDPAAAIAALLRLLAPEMPASAGSAERFRDVVRAVSQRLPPGVAAYPTGIIHDGSLVFATHHLQRELHELLSRRPGARPLAAGTALWSYLTGAPSAAERAPLLGRFRQRGLTASQRAAGELAAASRLAAVQGPPGTGKTELIHSLAAHALVARIEAWVRGQPMTGGLMVVASTNNRAVDNAIDPMGCETPDTRLPLALRGGNQEVTRTVTADELARASRWLAAQSDDGAAERLDEARQAFRRAAALLGALTAGRDAQLRRASRMEVLRRDLAALPSEPADTRAADEMYTALAELRDAIAALHKSARTRRGKVSRLAERWARLAKEQLAPALRFRPGLTFDVPSPIADPALARTAWMEALDDAVDEVEGALEGLDPKERRLAAERRARLEAELAELEAAPPEPPPDAAAEREIELGAHALFLAALEVRERWAIANRAALLAELQRAADIALKGGTLRRSLGTESFGLRALYPIVGCTLLSLGNVFPDEVDEIDHLVIDEAGQCHPAYPVGGLVRARRALFIGDVQQLAPVVTIAPRDEARVRRTAGLQLGEERLAPFQIHDRTGASAQALADRAVALRPTLSDHFRCQPAIIALSDALCDYRLTVHTPPRSLAASVARLSAPVLFDAVPGEQVRARGSWANPAEAERLAELLAELLAAGLPASEIGVLTPYVGQLEQIRHVLRRRRIAEPAIGTVHRFQGGERSVILLSTAITREADLRFMDERPNLLNVAVSRARDHLVTFGCEEVLARGRRTRVLFERAQRLPRA